MVTYIKQNEKKRRAENYCKYIMGCKNTTGNSVFKRHLFCGQDIGGSLPLTLFQQCSAGAHVCTGVWRISRRFAERLASAGEFEVFPQAHLTDFPSGSDRKAYTSHFHRLYDTKS